MSQQEIFFNCEQCKRKARLDQQYYIENKETIDFVCYFCYDDSIVKVWEFVEGDYNDVYSKHVIKATGKQMEEYIKSQFNEDRLDELEDLGSDSIGYCIYYPLEIDPETGEEYEDQESTIEYYAEAREIEDYEPKYGNIDIDLTEND